MFSLCLSYVTDICPPIHTFTTDGEWKQIYKQQLHAICFLQRQIVQLFMHHEQVRWSNQWKVGRSWRSVSCKCPSLTHNYKHKWPCITNLSLSRQKLFSDTCQQCDSKVHWNIHTLENSNNHTLLHDVRYIKGYIFLKL